ncbi:MAG: cellulase family glycosylhydrolase [Bacteroidales bacterium]|nr:cellulase family glycosylhydrolase [Bacteroidales bacterium]
MKNKVFLYVLLAFSVLQYSCKTEAAKEEVKTETPRFELHKGVNLSHWLSQCFGWSPRESFITEQDIKFIDSIGMDHVRIPVDEENLWDENGKKIQESFDYLHKCISWCKKYDLKVLVDLHIIRAHHFNALNGEGKNTLWTDTVAQANFVGLWYQLSDELKKYPTDFLAYEFLNEPVATDPDDWNKLIARCHKAIRAIEPERFIMIGSNEWQTPRMFPFLKIPENDKRIILAFHYYDPIFVTHYSAYWTEFKHYKGWLFIREYLYQKRKPISC